MAMKLLNALLSPSSRNTSTYTILPTSGSTHSRETSYESQLLGPSTEKDATLGSHKSTFKVDPRVISDATIGLSDGLTVPFALTAGLSALGDTRLVIYGGLAELIAGGISMGLGGYLGAASEAQAYEATLADTRRTVIRDAEHTHDLITSTFRDLGISDDVLDSMATQLLASQDNTESFLMRFHHQMPESSNEISRAYISGLTIALGYFLGGLTPLAPYFICDTVGAAFLWSVATMAIALFVFGYVKTLLLGEGKTSARVKAGVQMVVLGGVAAAAAVGSVKAIGA